MIVSPEQKALLRSGPQFSKFYLTGLDNPDVVFKARVNQTFTTWDFLKEFLWDDSTYGNYTDVLPGMTVAIGTTDGGHEIGWARVRKAPTNTTFYIGEESILRIAEDHYITVYRDYLLWAKHVFVDEDANVLMDGDIEYTDQNENFDPLVLIDAPKVVWLEPTISQVFNINDRVFRFIGTWVNGGSGAMNSDFVGSYAELEFFGREFTVNFGTGIYNGIAGIYVDDVLVNEVDTYLTDSYTSTGLLDTSHTLKVVVTGKKNPSSSWHWISIHSFVGQVFMAEVEATASRSFVFGSSISSFRWTCSDASSLVGENTGALTMRFTTPGKKFYYCTVRANNGKAFTVVRWVYVESRISPPESPIIVGQISGSYEDGGFSFTITAHGDASKSLLRDRAEVVLFAEDWYGAAKQSIGFKPGCENIVCVGYIAGETIRWSKDESTVTFEVKGANYFLRSIPGYPPGIGLRTTDEDSWVKVDGLNIDIAVWHLLHWRSTATLIMNINLSGNTLYSAGFETSSSTIWEQIDDMAVNSIFARPGVDQLGEFWLCVEPQLVPVPDRDWDVVYQFEDEDLLPSGEIRRRQVEDTSVVNISGISVTLDGKPSTWYALSPGHSLPHYGRPLTADRLLLEGQDQAIALAGAIYAFKNNPFPDVPLKVASNFRCVSMWPNQFISRDGQVEDTIREQELSMNLIVRGITYSIDLEGGFLLTELDCEAEVTPIHGVKGDIPNVDEDDTNPPKTKPPDDPYLPPGTNVSDLPKEMILLEQTRGFYYTLDGDSLDGAHWLAMNGGLDAWHRQNISEILVTQYGKIYIAYYGYDSFQNAGNELWCTDGLGGYWRQVFDNDWLLSECGAGPGEGVMLVAVGVNSVANDQIAMVAGVKKAGPPGYLDGHFYVGNEYGFSAGEHLLDLSGSPGCITFGGGQWSLTAAIRSIFLDVAIWNFSQSGSQIGPRIDYNDSLSPGPGHVRVGSSSMFYATSFDRFYLVTGNGSNIIETGGGKSIGFPYPLWWLGVEPTGQKLMICPSGGGAFASGDYGSTWHSINDILPLATRAFSWAKYNPNRWVAGGGFVWFTSDFGTSWLNISGNLAHVCSLPAVKYIKVLK
jgi:hypothetical protein